MKGLVRLAWQGFHRPQGLRRSDRAIDVTEFLREILDRPETYIDAWI